VPVVVLDAVRAAAPVVVRVCPVAASVLESIPVSVLASVPARVVVFREVRCWVFFK